MKLKLIIILISIYSSLFAREIIIYPEFIENEKIKEIVKSETNISKIKKNIEKYLNYKGYVFTKIQIITEESNKLFIKLDEGRINKIEITGNKKISASLLRIFIRFNENDIFNERSLKLQIKKLMTTNLFDKIIYKFYPDKKILIIKVKERPKRFFEFSGNYNSKLGFIPQIAYCERNIFKTELNLIPSIAAGLYQKINYYRFDFSLNSRKWEFKYFYRNGLNIFGKYNYNEELNNFKIIRNFNIGFNYVFKINFLIENHRFYKTNIDEKIFQGLRYSAGFNFLKSNKREVIEDFKEEYCDFLIELKKLRDNNYLGKFNLILKKYYQLLTYWGLVYKMNSGAILFNKEIPFDEKFLIGGEFQRGYAEGEFETKIKFQNSAQLEYEILIDRIYIILFSDYSLIESENKYISLISLGLGIRLNFLGYNVELQIGLPAKSPVKNFYPLIYLSKTFY